jgi:alpha-glucosidase
MIALGLLLLFNDFTVTAPPADRNLDPFYKKCITVRGLLILGSEKVSDKGLIGAAKIVDSMLQTVDPRVPQEMSKGIRCAIMAESEQTIDIPEHSDLNKAFPSTDWNKRARGLGATRERPVVSGAEENILGLKGDRYVGECIWAHEFAHSLFDFGVAIANPEKVKELRDAFANAKAKKLWENTYAQTNSSEYWAEGVQSYFDCNRSADPPNGIHNNIDTREKLEKYDPVLYKLINSIFSDNPWRWKDPAKG